MPAYEPPPFRGPEEYETEQHESEPTPLYRRGGFEYREDTFGDIDLEAEDLQLGYTPAGADIPTYGAVEQEEDIVRMGTPGYAIGEDGIPVDYPTASDVEDDEKNAGDFSFDGEEFLQREKERAREDRGGELDEEKGANSPAISFAGNFGAPPEVRASFWALFRPRARES